jgi:hypothetical protein
LLRFSRTLNLGKIGTDRQPRRHSGPDLDGKFCYLVDANLISDPTSENNAQASKKYCRIKRSCDGDSVAVAISYISHAETAAVISASLSHLPRLLSALPFRLSLKDENRCESSHRLHLEFGTQPSNFFRIASSWSRSLYRICTVPPSPRWSNVTSRPSVSDRRRSSARVSASLPGAARLFF